MPPTYSRLVSSFEVGRLGFGLENNGTGPADCPMAYAVVGLAAAVAGDTETAVSACDWLVDNKRTSTGIGWGLGWAWDAFSDGEPNPSDTIYGITSALAVEALLRASTLTGRDAYLTVAVQALDHYAGFSTTTAAGLFFWYSEVLADAKNVHNVSAMLAGQYSLAAGIASRSDFQQLADAAFAELAAQMMRDGERVSWHYADLPNPRANDLVHAAYIAHGLDLGGVRDPTRTECLSMLRGYMGPDGPMEFSRHGVRDDLREKRARGWGVGMLAHVARNLGDEQLATAAIDAMADYEFEPNAFSYVFGDRVDAVRSRAHLLLGVAGKA